jgi:hypothetical protein
MALLYGRAGRLTAESGGFRPGQMEMSHQALQQTASEKKTRRPDGTSSRPQRMRQTTRQFDQEMMGGAVQGSSVAQMLVPRT